MNTWYSKQYEQGMVIDEATGENVAVTYDPKYATEIATLHNMTEHLIASLNFLIRVAEVEGDGLYKAHIYVAQRQVEELQSLLEEKI